MALPLTTLVAGALSCLLLISCSRIHIPETDATLELPNFRFVAIIGSTQLLKLSWRSFEGMMVAPQQEGSDRQYRG